MSMTSIPRWAMLVAAAVLVLLGVAAHLGWLRDPTLARSDYVGSTDVSAEEARQYRAVPFEWRVTSAQGSFKGNDTAYIRIDPTGERTLFCGWLRIDGGGNAIRATRWLSEARLVAGELVLPALFIAPAEKGPGDGLVAGCLRLDEPVKPATDTPLRLEGPAVRE